MACEVGVQMTVTYINHCNVENLTASSLSRNCAVSCSILVSVSFNFSSCTFASSLIRPFSRFRSSRTDACVRCISSRSLEFNFASSLVSRSWDARVNDDSVESAVMSSDRSFAKSTFCVYVAFSWSSRRTIVRVRFCMLEVVSQRLSNYCP